MAPEHHPAEPEEVERTGLALVHAGDRIYPAPGAEAELAPGGNVVRYYFPVEVEIVGAGDAQALMEAIFRALQQELAAVG